MDESNTRARRGRLRTAAQHHHRHHQQHGVQLPKCCRHQCHSSRKKQRPHQHGNSRQSAPQRSHQIQVSRKHSNSHQGGIQRQLLSTSCLSSLCYKERSGSPGQGSVAREPLPQREPQKPDCGRTLSAEYVARHIRQPANRGLSRHLSGYAGAAQAAESPLPPPLRLRQVRVNYTDVLPWTMRPVTQPRCVEHTLLAKENPECSVFLASSIAISAHTPDQLLWQEKTHRTHEDGKRKKLSTTQVSCLGDAGTLLPAVNTNYTSPFLLLSLQSVYQPPLQLLLDMHREQLLFPTPVQRDRGLFWLQSEAQVHHNSVADVVRMFLRVTTVPCLPSHASALRARKPAAFSFDTSDAAAGATWHSDGGTIATKRGVFTQMHVTMSDTADAPPSCAADPVQISHLRRKVAIARGTASAATAQKGGVAAVAAAEKREEPSAGVTGAAARVAAPSARAITVYIPARDGSTVIPVTLLLPAGASTVTVIESAASDAPFLILEHRGEKTAARGPRRHRGYTTCEQGDKCCSGVSSACFSRLRSSSGSEGADIGGMSDFKTRHAEGRHSWCPAPFSFSCVHAKSPMRFLVLCYGAYKQPQQVGFSPLLSLLLTPHATTDGRACANVEAHSATSEGVASTCFPWGVAIAHTRGEGVAVPEGHSCGRGIRKGEGITDLADVLQWLLACNLTRREFLVVKACSAGGVLAAALYSLQAMRQYAAAVVLKQPFVDPLTSFILTTAEHQAHQDQHQRRQDHRWQSPGPQPQQQHLRQPRREKPELYAARTQLQAGHQHQSKNYVQMRPARPGAWPQGRKQRPPKVKCHPAASFAQSESLGHLILHEQECAYPLSRVECFDLQGRIPDARRLQYDTAAHSAASHVVHSCKAADTVEHPRAVFMLFSPTNSQREKTQFQRSEETWSAPRNPQSQNSSRRGFREGRHATENTASRDYVATGPTYHGAATSGKALSRTAPSDALLAIEIDEWGNPFAFTSAAVLPPATEWNTAAFGGSPPDAPALANYCARSAFSPALRSDEEVPLALLSMLSYSPLDNFHPPQCFTPPTLATPGVRTHCSQSGSGVAESAAAVKDPSLCCSRCGSWRCLGSTQCYEEMGTVEEHQVCSGSSSAAARSITHSNSAFVSSRRAETHEISERKWNARNAVFKEFSACTDSDAATCWRREWPHLWISASMGDTTVRCWQSCNLVMRLHAVERLRRLVRIRMYHGYQRDVQPYTAQKHFHNLPKAGGGLQQEGELQHETPGDFSVCAREPIGVMQQESELAWQHMASHVLVNEKNEELAKQDSFTAASVHFRLDGDNLGHVGSSDYAAHLLDDAEEVCFLLKVTEAQSDW